MNLKKTCFVGFRIDENEMLDLQENMKRAGYSSISIYIRDLLCNQIVKKVRVRKVTDENLMRVLEDIRFQVRKAGVNINQVAVTYNAAAKRVDQNGRSMINTRRTEHALSDLNGNLSLMNDSLAIFIRLLKERGVELEERPDTNK